MPRMTEVYTIFAIDVRNFINMVYDANFNSFLARV